MRMNMFKGDYCLFFIVALLCRILIQIIETLLSKRGSLSFIIVIGPSSLILGCCVKPLG